MNPIEIIAYSIAVLIATICAIIVIPLILIMLRIGIKIIWNVLYLIAACITAFYCYVKYKIRRKYKDAHNNPYREKDITGR